MPNRSSCSIPIRLTLSELQKTKVAKAGDNHEFEYGNKKNEISER